MHGPDSPFPALQASLLISCEREMEEKEGYLYHCFRKMNNDFPVPWGAGPGATGTAWACTPASLYTVKAHLQHQALEIALPSWAGPQWLSLIHLKEAQGISCFHPGRLQSWAGGSLFQNDAAGTLPLY